MITPGVCLTFDDLYVENWLAAGPIFQAHDARATFCVCWMHAATPAQIDGLHQLQEDGHEIAYHGRNHEKLQPYLRQHGLDHWLENEIARGVAEHRALGFPTTSYASPFYGSNRQTRAATAPYFQITRAGSGRDLSVEDVPKRIYQRPDPDGAVSSIGLIDFQNPGSRSWREIGAALDMLVAHRGVGIFNGHDIRPRKAGPGRYSAHRQIDRLLRAITDRGLAFHTLSGFARAAQADQEAPQCLPASR
ncbi:polysaccharide deacetylase family protein [Roseovarius confluentis]|uniref:polysaccharide deacetylase family protein n=1 Tax=Roseovarius confluentis TaxID=1852027 RepID=UPI000CDDED55|nr:polysaccharide deacetylase family protein [Roseovarius confluentis]